MTHILILAAWAIYFLMHSLLAANSVKERVHSKSPWLFSHYRIIYNIIAVAGLIILSRSTFEQKDQLLFENGITRFLAYGLIVISSIVFIISLMSFDLSEFSGIRRSKHRYAQEQLITTGIYRFVRHPLYFATILLFLGLFFLKPTALFLELFILVIIYLLIGSRLEETKLSAQFGSQYENYKKEVKGLIPFIM